MPQKDERSSKQTREEETSCYTCCRLGGSDEDLLDSWLAVGKVEKIPWFLSSWF